MYGTPSSLEKCAPYHSPLKYGITNPTKQILLLGTTRQRPQRIISRENGSVSPVAEWELPNSTRHPEDVDALRFPCPPHQIVLRPVLWSELHCYERCGAKTKRNSCGHIDSFTSFYHVSLLVLIRCNPRWLRVILRRDFKGAMRRSGQLELFGYVSNMAMSHERLKCGTGSGPRASFHRPKPPWLHC